MEYKYQASALKGLLGFNWNIEILDDKDVVVSTTSVPVEGSSAESIEAAAIAAVDALKVKLADEAEKEAKAPALDALVASISPAVQTPKVVPTPELDPVDPVDPVGPVDPVDPVDPIVPVEPVVAVDPAEEIIP